MAIRVIFKLKEPQAKIPPAAQKETPVNLFFNYGYFVKRKEGKKKYTPLKYATGESIKPCFWKDRPVYRAKQVKEFDYENFNIRLDNIEGAIKKVYRTEVNAGRLPAPDQLRDLLSSEVRLRPVIHAENLKQYMERFKDDIKAGTRTTNDGKKYKHGTVRNYEGLIQQLDHFQKKKGKQYDFGEITIDFYDDFVRFFNDKQASPNTIGKHIKSLKAVMRAAKDEGLHTSSEFERKKFKAIKTDVQDVYLSREEIGKLTAVDLSKDKVKDLVRDVFLVGYYTAQRYSDYSRIRKENIRKLPSRKRVIDLVQQKTGERVIIPLGPELDRILKKYHYNLPKTFEQKVNENIKKVAEKAGITEKVYYEATEGGMRIPKSKQKNELIKTHTARRSGATNMYLAGILTIDIMKLTGHKTEREFMKYVKVGKEETADKLSRHSFFTNHLKIAK